MNKTKEIQTTNFIGQVDSNNGKIKFGTGGWRAIIGDDYIRSNVCRVANAVAHFAKTHNVATNPIIIGYDRRFLSKSSSEWIAEVLSANGIKTLLMERSTPTPLVMFMVKHYNYDFGIEVTASHNPSDYNGIKLIVKEGRDADLKTTAEIEKIIEEQTGSPVKYVPICQAKEMELVQYFPSPFDDFIDNILDKLNCSAIKKRGLRILFDPMHGSGTYPFTVIMNTLRCTVDIINSNKDAYFGGKAPAPTAAVLQELKNGVIDGGYDLGIAFDGDGDRLGIIDKNGRYIEANEILCLLYYYLHEYKKWTGPVVRNLATTHRLDKLAQSFGEKCYEVPIGFKYISSTIDKYDCVLGGESSGGLTVRGHIHGKDSIYASALFIEMICATNKTPSEMLEEFENKFGKSVMTELNLKFAPEIKTKIYNTLMVEQKLPKFSTNVNIIKTNYEDGCKVYFEDDSFVICRFSGTEPLLRIFAEAKNKEIANSYINDFRVFLN